MDVVFWLYSSRWIDEELYMYG